MTYQKPTLSPDLLFKDMGDEGILLNPNTSAYYRITPLGVKVLNLILNPTDNSFDADLRTIVKGCSEETGVTEAQIHSDLENFFSQLNEAEITQAS